MDVVEGSVSATPSPLPPLYSSMGGWLLVVGTIGALLAFVFMRTSLDIFFWRKSSQAIRERRPIEWRDPHTWIERKRPPYNG